MKKKILVIDDSATARMLFKICLSGQDEYILLEASTEQEAMKHVKEENPVLVVFDYNMPDMVGTELAALMREQGVTVPFALMSANTQQHVIDEVEALGFIQVMEKPVTAEMVHMLLEKIR